VETVEMMAKITQSVEYEFPKARRPS